jgi:hypothetical protein
MWQALNLGFNACHLWFIISFKLQAISCKLQAQLEEGFKPLLIEDHQTGFGGGLKPELL